MFWYLGYIRINKILQKFFFLLSIETKEKKRLDRLLQ